ncbi:MAG: Gfo/Idh/MocA family protein [Candidatus Micrarchaeaceae archaeon]
MEYRLGVIGLGHWFKWLKTGIGVTGGLELKKAVGTRPFEEKKDILSGFGITEGNYYISEGNGGVPSQFFDDIDVVHISDPNKFHAAQTMDSLEHGKYVITEKTLAVNRSQFNETAEYIRERGFEDMIYLHLHYLHKRPTAMLKTMLPKLIRDNGRIRSVEATFFEKTNSEDLRRTWLLEAENGGIYMDWIHPYEVMFYATRCSFGDITELGNFVVNGSYSERNPTGVETTLEVRGDNYTADATALVRVAKGVESRYSGKYMKIIFESGNYALLCYPGHEVEFSTAKRGSIRLVDGDTNSTVMSKSFSGSNSSELFVGEVIDFCNGNHKGLRLSDMEEIFKPQWEYQDMLGSAELVKDSSKVSAFLDRNAEEGMQCDDPS